MNARPNPSRSSRRGPGEAIAELRGQAARQVHALVTGENWGAWLQVAARFPGWSFTNVMLIAAQQPNATRLAGYAGWQALGRQVRKGEAGIRIITEPGARPGQVRSARRPAAPEPQPRPRIAHVWDVSQTNGPPATASAQLPAGAVTLPGLWETLIWLARRKGFAVERGECSTDSATDWTAHRIQVSAGLDDASAAHALLHELGHVLTQAGVPHAPEETTAGCRGVRKVEADSVAFVVAARLGMDTSLYRWPSVGTWAGTDPRARTAEAVRTVGVRIMRAAAVIVSHLDRALFRKPADTPVVRAEERQPGRDGIVIPAGMAPTEEEVRRALAEAELFYRAQLRGSWVPDYLAGRRLTSAARDRWRAGYAPGGWTALTSYLRRCGYRDQVIETAGLARRTARDTLIDCFRDRVVFAVRDERGRIAGFIGRGRPDAAAAVPKYLNSPQTLVYRKGELLYGLAEGRDLLARGATPVIVEGPFDAIAVTEAGDGRYVGLAPCGTALTDQQVATLAGVADLEGAGVLVALDGDRAGRKGIVRAYELLLAHTSRLSAAIMSPGRDPAEVMQHDGPTALNAALRGSESLARVVIDDHLDGWTRQLAHAEGQLAAMRSAAKLVARTLPSATVEATLRSVGRMSSDVVARGNTDLVGVAQLLPAAAIAQILRIAERTESTHHEVTAHVVVAATQGEKEPRSPPHVIASAQRTMMERPAREANAPAPRRRGQPSHRMMSTAAGKSRKSNP